MNTHPFFRRLIIPALVLFGVSVSILHGETLPTGGAGNPLSTRDDGRTLRITIIPHRSTVGNFHAYAELMTELEKEIRMNIRMLGSRSYEAAVEKLKKKQADIAYLGPFAYVTAQDDFGVRLLVRTLDKNRDAFYRSLIVTQADSPVRELKDLRRRSFAFTDRKSTSGFLFPLVAIRKAGLTLSDFSRVEYMKRHANSLLSVFNGFTDAGAISSTAPAKVDVDFSRFRIIWKSGPIYRGPWVSRKGLPESVFEKIKAALLKITRHKNADRIFEKMSTKGFIPGKDSDYDNVREVRELKRSLERTD